MTVAREGTAEAGSQRKRGWDAQGYLLARRLFGPGEVARLLEACEHARRHWAELDPTRNCGVENDESFLMRHVNQPAYFRDRPELLRTLLETLRRSAADRHGPRGLRRSAGLLPHDLLVQPVRNNRSGNWHRDTQFLTRNDEEEKTMLFGGMEMALQLEVALVASDDVEVVPGSHLRGTTRTLITAPNDPDFGLGPNWC